MQTELTSPSPLLDARGGLRQVGWARQPVLDCNLEQARFYPAPLRALQRFRVKRWDYYAVFTPRRFFSATIADLGYAGNLFVYTLDFASGALHEEGLVIPLGRGIALPRSFAVGLFALSVTGIVLLPVSGFWLALVPAWLVWRRAER